MKNPEISVLMCVYQEPVEWLRASVESVLHQTFRDFELIIVVDDPEGDERHVLLNDYAAHEPRIVLHRNERNFGIALSLNIGMELARGKYIARMDADDISDKHRLERQYEFMEAHDDVVLLGTDIRIIGKNAWLHPTDNIRFEDDAIKAQMLMGNCIAHPSVMMRRHVLETHGLRFEQAYNYCEDYRLWEKLMPLGKFACLKEKLLYLRLSEMQMSKKHHSDMIRQASDVRSRLQQAWLRHCGYERFTEEDLMYRPLEVLKELRDDKRVNRTLEYKAFVQYAYLSVQDKKKRVLAPFLNGDIRYFSILNVLRLVFGCLCSNYQEDAENN